MFRAYSNKSFVWSYVMWASIHPRNSVEHIYYRWTYPAMVTPWLPQLPKLILFVPNAVVPLIYNGMISIWGHTPRSKDTPNKQWWLWLQLWVLLWRVVRRCTKGIGHLKWTVNMFSKSDPATDNTFIVGCVMGVIITHGEGIHQGQRTPNKRLAFEN